MSQHHHNPIFSVVIGSFIGLVNYISSFGMSENGIELLKLIVFGIIGGVSGYLGRQLAITIHNRFKK